MNGRAEQSAGAKLYRSALVWDMVWPLEPWCGNDYDKLPQFHAAGVNVISITLAGDNHNVGEAMARVAAARRWLSDNSDRYVPIVGTADVRRAEAEGKLGVAFHFEGTRCFERNLDMIEAFYQLGVRHTLLAFNQSNSVGGGCGEAADGGLTRFGANVIREMNRVGMIVDLSHTGYRTTMEAMEIATRPVMFSHSNSAAVAPHFRNLQDDQVQACAATGGIVGVSSASDYLGVRTSSPEAIFRHIDHYAGLVGARHVGLGLDIVFDNDVLNNWIRSRPAEWPGTDHPDWPGFNYARPDHYVRLTEIMVEHGYREADIRGILGENFLNLCAANW
ncbi:MAG: membrane dipeptidase, partial [Sphingomonadales bacterium]